MWGKIPKTKPPSDYSAQWIMMESMIKAIKQGSYAKKLAFPILFWNVFVAFLTHYHEFQAKNISPVIVVFGPYHSS